MFNKICTNSDADKKNLIILSGFRFFEEDCIRVKIKMKKFNLFFILRAISIKNRLNFFILIFTLIQSSSKKRNPERIIKFFLSASELVQILLNILPRKIINYKKT